MQNLISLSITTNINHLCQKNTDLYHITMNYGRLLYEFKQYYRSTSLTDDFFNARQASSSISELLKH